jgi:hypothetical protein
VTGAENTLDNDRRFHGYRKLGSTLKATLSVLFSSVKNPSKAAVPAVT